MSAPKLPLVVRKSIRDEFDGPKDALLAKFKDLLEVDYKFEIDFAALYPQCDDGYQQDSIGKICLESMEDLLNSLKRFTDEGDNKAAVEGFNSVVSKHALTVVIDEKFPDSYNGCRIVDGVYEIVFKPKGLGTNSSSANEKLGLALDAAIASSSPKALPLTAKMGLQKDWLDKKADLEKKLSEQLNGETLTCHADYDDMWSKIIEGKEALPKSKKDDIDLEHCARNFGYFLHSYFESLLDKMKYEFKNDDMIVEAFMEEISTKEAWFAIVKDGELKDSYVDTVIENGKLYAKTKPSMFGTNVNNAFDGIMKML